MRAPGWRLPIFRTAVLGAVVLAVMAAALLLLQPAPEASAQSVITYSLDSNLYNVREGDNLRMKVRFSAPLPSDQTLETTYVFAGQTADAADVATTQGTDYTVPAGATEYDIHVFINQDNVIEPKERFYFSLSDSSAVITSGSPNGATVNIFNVTVVPDDWALLPSGVNPGQQFRLLFVTDATSQSTTTNLSAYGNFVRNRVANHGHADIRAHASGFEVVGSTPSVDAHVQTGTGSDVRTQWNTPIYWLNGSKIAGYHADFWDGSWQAQARTDARAADGAAPSPLGRHIWTGTQNGGTKSDHPMGNSPNVTYGELETGSNPISQGEKGRGHGETFYGISQVFQREGRRYYGAQPQQLFFASDDYQFTEGDAVRVTLRLRYAELTPTSVTLSTDNVVANALHFLRRDGQHLGNTVPAQDADYEGFTDRQITIPAGHTSHTFEIPTHKDSLDEANGETFRVNIRAADVPIATSSKLFDIFDMPKVVLSRDNIETEEPQSASCEDSKTGDEITATRHGPRHWEYTHEIGAVLHTEQYTVRLDRSPGPGKYVRMEIWEPTDLLHPSPLTTFGKLAAVHGAGRETDGLGRISIDNSRAPMPDRKTYINHMSRVLHFFDSDWDHPRTVTVNIHCAHHDVTRPVPVWHFAFRRDLSQLRTSPYLSTAYILRRGDNSPANASLKIARVRVADRTEPDSIANTNITGELALAPSRSLVTSSAGGSIVQRLSLDFYWKNPDQSGRLNDHPHAVENFAGFRVKMRTVEPAGHPPQERFLLVNDLVGTRTVRPWQTGFTASGLLIGGRPQPVLKYEWSVVPVDWRWKDVEQERVTICRELKQYPNGIAYVDLNSRPDCPPAPMNSPGGGQGSPPDNPGPGQGGIGGGPGVQFPDPPGPPEAHTVSEITQTSMTVTWRDRDNVGAYFVIWGDTSQSNEDSAELVFDNTYTITGLEPDTEYSVVVYSGDYFPISILARHRTLAPSGTTEPEISVTAGSGITEGGDASFTVSADPAPTADLDVSVTVSQSGDFGVATGAQTVTIPTAGSYTLTVSTTGDDLEEADGSVTATIDDGTGYTVSSSAGAATVVVSDDDPAAAAVCTPQLPDDAVTVEEVTEWRDKYPHKADHVKRWNKVLAALGVEGTGETAMTVAESKENESRFIPALWNRVTRTLEALEECAGSTDADAQQDATPQADPEVSVTAGGAVTEGGDAVFTITADPAPTANLDVSVTVSQSGDYGVATGSQTVTIPTTGSYTLTVATSDDGVDEADGSVTATVNTGDGYTVSSSAGAATVAVSDDDDPPAANDTHAAAVANGSVTIEAPDSWTGRGRPQVTGGAHQLDGWTGIQFSVSGLGAPPATLTVSWASRPSGDVSLPLEWQPVAGADWQSSDGGPIGLTKVKITDQAPTPEVSVTAGGDITEGGDASFTITVNPAPTSALTVGVTVSQSGDYGVTTGKQTVTILTSGSYTLTVATGDDSVHEADGSVTATVNTGGGYTVSSSNGAATVAVSDDDVPEISVTAGSGITEGGDASFTITANPAPTSALTVGVSVSQSGDYGAATGKQTVTIPTSGSYTFTVATSNDSVDEADGSVTVTVNTGNGYTVSSSSGAATVAVSDDDDPMPAPPAPTPEVSVTAGGGITEGGDASFTITANPAPTSALTVGVSVSQSGDYGAVTGKQTVSIPTTGSYILTVATSDDSVDEADGSVIITVNTGNGYTVSSSAGAATVAVSDDDVPEISVDAGSGITEGGDASFTITANPAPHAALSVKVSVSQSGDYGVAEGSRTVTIPTSGSYTLAVPTYDDSNDETDGSVTVTVNDGDGYTVSSSAGSATVAVSDNDDPPPPPSDEVSVSVNDASAREDAGSIDFVVSLSKASDEEVRVQFTTALGTADKDSDYVDYHDWLTFAPGETQQAVSVELVDDAEQEGDETVWVWLNFPTGGAVLGDRQGIGTIVDDD